ncbi:hypothetical protein LTS10_003655 [Elasticomyces elasticus]|nr:hypothetical protein LTS10_003655 [Elasticomyces elasticus]
MKLSALILTLTVQGAFAKTNNVCTGFPYNLAQPYSTFAPALSFCSFKFPVAPVTTYITTTPTSIKTTTVQAPQTATTTTLVTVVASTETDVVVETTFKQYKRNAATAASKKSASLSSAWKGCTSSLTKYPSALKTACSCIQSTSTVTSTITAKTPTVKTSTITQSAIVTTAEVTEISSVTTTTTVASTTTISACTPGPTIYGGTTYNILCGASVVLRPGERIVPLNHGTPDDLEECMYTANIVSACAGILTPNPDTGIPSCAVLYGATGGASGCDPVLTEPATDSDLALYVVAT